MAKENHQPMGRETTRREQTACSSEPSTSTSLGAGNSASCQVASRAPRELASQARVVRLALVLGLFGLASLGLWLSQVMRAGPQFPWARATQEEADEENSLLFLLAGPNDGELINGRHLPLELRTDYNLPGRLVILLHGREVLRRPLLESGFREARNVFVTHLTIDLLRASRLLGEDLLHPDAGPIRVTARLYAPNNSFVTSYLWSGFVGKPWVELLPPRTNLEPGLVQPAIKGGDGLESDGRESIRLPDIVRLELHAGRTDIFFLVVAAPQRDILERSPNEPSLLLDGRLLETGAFPPAPSGESVQTLVSIDTRRLTQWQHTFVVLWTLDTSGQWERSGILPLVLR